MGKIGDLVNRIISPLLNRSTDSQTVADPRRGRIGYVGNITLISQLINDAEYSTDNGTVTNVNITAGKFKGVTDDAPDPDEFIPNFQVPTKTSHLTNNGDGSIPIRPYGTGTITGLRLKKKKYPSGDYEYTDVPVVDGVAKIKIGTDMGDYSNDPVAFSKNPGTMISLTGEAGKPYTSSTEAPTTQYPRGTAYNHIIKIPTSTKHVTDTTYVNKDYFENTYKFVFNNISVNKDVIAPIGTTSFTLYDQNFINSYIKIYTFGKIVFIYGDVPNFKIESANINERNNMQILEIKKSDIFMPNVYGNKIVGNGMLSYTANNQVRRVPIYIEYYRLNSTTNVKLSMVTCDPLNGNDIDRTYNAYSVAGSFFAWWYISK